MTLWSSLSKLERTDAVELRLLANKTYNEIAAEFETTKGAVAGFILRQSLTSLAARSRRQLPPIGARNPIIRQIFVKAEADNISLNTLATKSGHDYNVIQNTRRGDSIPHLNTITDMAAVVGLELTLKEKAND